jgi:hypothetical protein
LINAILEVVDELIDQNRHPPFDELLVQLLMQRSEYYTFICSYAGKLLSDNTFEKQFVGSSR